MLQCEKGVPRRFLSEVESVLYPGRCLCCFESVDKSGRLCADCFRDTTFLTGLCCDGCGAPLPGEGGEKVLCDECLRFPMPWAHGRAAILYSGAGKRAVLGLKHADRLDSVPALAGWMDRAGADLLDRADLLVPVPVHWRRLLRRRYNQSVELARALGRTRGIQVAPTLLRRSRATGTQDGKSREERYRNLVAAIRVNPRNNMEINGKNIVLIDDVMTSGATLSACAEALAPLGPSEINALTLARVAQYS